MGKIIAVINQKGGVGKTTTSVNLASCLAYNGKKTLIIDSDPQSNATSGLGLDPRTVTMGLYECLTDVNNIHKAIVPTKYDNLYILPATNELIGAEIELALEENREVRLKNALEIVKSDYDFIIIDSPPALGMLTINILTASNSVLIPIQCEYYALEGLSRLTSTIKLIKKSFNPHLAIEGVLATMYDGRTNLSIQVLEEVKKFFTDKVCKSVIPRNVRLSEAPSFGLSIVDYDITSKGAQSYLELSKEIIANN